MSQRWEGVFAALTTPFAGEEISVEKFRGNIERYNRTGLAGYVVLGSTGEAVFLGDDEAERLVAAAKASASLDKILIVGAAHESARKTVELANRLAGLGADAVLVKPPHYYKSRMTAEALRQFYFRVADECRVPVIIYNIPQNTGVPVEPPLVVELARHPNIAGIKDSSGVLANLAEARPQAKADFRFFIGTGSILLPGLLLGASGGILAMASTVPELCARLYSLFREGKLTEAQKLQLDLVPLNKALTQTMGIPAVKYALDLLGYSGGLPRSPLLPLGDADKATIRDLLRRLNLLTA
jgi:4-hydroxy-2-oxoglutarate aldolase